MPSDSDALWYKDAVIYQAHVRAFFDSNNDGVGDFPGLTQKLDYLHGPRHQLPVAPALLSVAAARRRVRHRRLREHPSELRHAGGLRSVHRGSAPARHPRDHRAGHQSHVGSAPVVPGGATRAGRIAASAISTSGATRTRSTRACASSSPTPRRSNWQWDDTAKAYYWHRFFHHQPDLNFDNPGVLERRDQASCSSGSIAASTACASTPCPT